MRVRLGRKLHPSWLVAWFAAAVIGGIAAAFWWHSSELISIYIVIISTALIIVALLNRTMVMVIPAIAAGLLLGLWRGSQVQLTAGKYQNFINQTVRLQATVADDATHKNHQTGLKLQNVHINGQKFGGQIWVG